MPVPLAGIEDPEAWVRGAKRCFELLMLPNGEMTEAGIDKRMREIADAMALARSLFDQANTKETRSNDQSTTP